MSGGIKINFIINSKKDITHGATDGSKPSPKEVVEIRKNLEKYCGLDTEGMVDILKVLNEMVI